MPLTRDAYGHMKCPHGMEPLACPDVTGIAGAEGQGPFYVVSLKIEKGSIAAAAFRTYCCPWSTAVGSAVTKWAEGKKICGAQSGLVEFATQLDWIPRDKRDLLSLCILALHNALDAAGKAVGNESSA